MKVCLVTGAAGFIGQHLVSKLSSDGYHVIAIDKNRDYLPLIFQENNIKTTEMPVSNVSKGTVIFRYGDIADKDFIRILFEDIEKCGWEIHFIFHLAACATIQEAIKEREKTYKTNYDGTFNILSESILYYQKHKDIFRGFFYASTDKVYGEGSLSTYHENDELRPLPYPYDQSKAKADILVRQTAKENNFPAVVYRFCNVYGPGDYHASRIVPGTLYRVLYKKEKPMLHVYKDLTGKLQSFYRDMIYIDDLTQAIILLLKHMETTQNISEITGEAFNLGTGHTYDMKPVIANIMKELGSHSSIDEKIVEKGEIKQQCMDYAKLKKKFGFEPQYSLDLGLQKTVRWYVEHMEDICEKFT